MADNSSAHDVRPPDLDGAAVYVETSGPAVWGRWYVRTDGSVVHQRASGQWETNRVIVSAETLKERTSTWRLARPDELDASVGAG